MIDEFLTKIQSRIGDVLSPLWDYLYLAEWWVLALVVLAVAMVIGYFAPFNWVRATLGFLVLVFWAFVAGITAASKHYSQERAADHARIRELERGQKKDRGWFG